MPQPDTEHECTLVIMDLDNGIGLIYLLNTTGFTSLSMAISLPRIFGYLSFSSVQIMFIENAIMNNKLNTENK
uniref:Uncharacterized protein n=1 Tax=Romanomermis culicivorax TaxID=13658 RepID=A0A915HWS9_ROMCU